ncbi:MAG TPA: 3-dehydroquinate synthase, partial [Polyangiaceae bacterium]|nr:3-dehydroquinate synthase [Polyangiaceae bacterium]
MEKPPSPYRPARVHDQEFKVAFQYPVAFCRGALEPADQTLAWALSRREPERRHPIYAVLDGGLVKCWPDLEAKLRTYVAAHDATIELRGVHVVPGGEAAKNDPALIEDLLARFAKAKLDRQAVVLGIGGGAVLDAVGYAASVTHRGLRVVRMPTTVLAQNDAGVGVKTSINGFGAKNFLGTFAPPFAVVNDAELLATLPARDARAGLAEAVKVALIRDPSFFEWLEANADALRACDLGALETSIERCAKLHLQHIAGAGDPFEMGSARPLDYGHWSAHKLEIISDHALRHGEAVAIGMALDARYAERKGMLSAAALERVCGLLEKLGLSLYHPALSAENGGRLAVLTGLQDFREHLGGKLTVTLLKGVGSSVEVSEIDEREVTAAIRWLEERGLRSCA